ncbi:hypothetical protein [Dactylosporangium sp. CA-139066]|uniref:hypothetical protein n=1 Tax=Dactylosporangium sp. CA-139066 TaxID=3239930 RepID=UPI003D9350AB
MADPQGPVRRSGSRAVKLAASSQRFALNLLIGNPFVRFLFNTMATLGKFPITVFAVALCLRDPAWSAPLLVGSAVFADRTIRSGVLAAYSFMNIRNATTYADDLRYVVTEVDPEGVVDEEVFDALLGPVRRRTRRVRIFTRTRGSVVSTDDRTFISYSGTSYVFMSRDPRQAKGAGVKFRLLHELGHASKPALRSWEEELAGGFPLLVLMSTLPLFWFDPLWGPVFLLLLLALGRSLLLPAGPNRFNLDRELAADQFAISQMSTAEAARGVQVALVGPLEQHKQTLKAAAAARDYSHVPSITTAFLVDPHPHLFDLLRPSRYLSESPGWLYEFELNRMSIRADRAKSALRATNIKGRPGVRTQSAGIWPKAQALLVIAIVIAASWQISASAALIGWLVLVGAAGFGFSRWMRRKISRQEAHFDLTMVGRVVMQPMVDIFGMDLLTQFVEHARGTGPTDALDGVAEAQTGSGGESGWLHRSISWSNAFTQAVFIFVAIASVATIANKVTYLDSIVAWVWPFMAAVVYPVASGLLTRARRGVLAALTIGLPVATCFGWLELTFH